MDSSGSAGKYTSIAIDSSGKVHISYYDETNLDLKYATNASGSWVTTTVDSSGSVGSYTSIAIGSSDKVHISYYDGTKKDLIYATNASGSWVTTTVDSSGSVGEYTSIAIDSSGKVHISYHDASNLDLKYATNASGSWVKTIVDSSGDKYSSIAIDSSGNVHISYRQSSTWDLRYATNTSGSWVAATLDSPGYTLYYTSIAIDSSDKIHISYYDNFHNELNYVTNASGSWVTTTVDVNAVLHSPIMPGSGGSYTSIAIDSSDIMHISYYDSVSKNLKYARNDGDGDGYTESEGDCNDSNPLINPGAAEVCDGIDNNCDNNIDEGLTDSDNDGYAICRGDCNDSDPLINPGAAEVPFNGKDDDCNAATPDNDLDGDGYSNSTDCNDSNSAVHPGAAEIPGNCTDDDCNSATSDIGMNGDWQLECLDNFGDVGQYDSIAIDSSGNIHISYYDATNEDLKYATNTSGTWVKTTVESTGNVGMYSSIAVDSSGKVHISYYDSTNSNLKYAKNASGSWVINSVDQSGMVSGPTSIGVDSTGKAHIVYATNAEALNYATNKSGDWIISILEQDLSTCPESFYDISLNIDSSDNVHASFIKENNCSDNSYYLKYINVSSGWGSQTVDSYAPYRLQGSIKHTSITTDSLGNAHISYVSTGYLNGVNMACRLSHATNSSGSWGLEPIVTYTESCQTQNELGATSIVSDSADKIHIAYKAFSSIRHATNASGSWMYLEQIGSGTYPSLAIDSADFMHVSYYNGDLVYATNNQTYSIDNDGDGYSGSQGDCNDSDPLINPGAAEICDGLDNDCDTQVDEGLQHDLTTSVNQTGGGSINPDCSGGCSYTCNTQVNLTTTPDIGFTFAGWSGNADCSDGQVVMESNRICTANFVINIGFDFMNFNLSSGWNLISLPVQPSNTSIGTFLDPISSLYNIIWGYENSEWKMNNPATPIFNTLETMEAEKGYWIYMTAPATVTVSGGIPFNSIELVNGWNLVGFNSKTAKPITDVLASIDGKYISVWAFIDGNWQFYAPGNIFNTLETMEPGYGYWINANQACTWTLPR